MSMLFPKTSSTLILYELKFLLEFLGGNVFIGIERDLESRRTIGAEKVLFILCILEQVL